MPTTNPFKPTAGAEPPVLIGRDKVIDGFIEGLDDGVGAPARLMRITGPRGSGKTVLLTELGDIARNRGWIVVDETAGPDLLANIVRVLRSGSPHGNVSADINLGVAQLHAETSPSDDVTFRETLTRATESPAARKAGVLITIDEAQDADRADMQVIAATVQHLIREKKNIAMVFAGITTGVLDMINGPSLTFLRRAKSEELDSLPVAEVADAMQLSFEKTGMHIEGETLDRVAAATSGYAFLTQLVGYYVWRRSAKHRDDAALVLPQDAEKGIEDASREFESTVLDTALAGLPLRCVEYLLAMADDDGASSTAEVANRVGLKASTLTSTRRTLISRQVIEPTARGYVRFSIPRMREYLLANKEGILARYGK